MNKVQTIQNFTSLKTWQEGHQLVLQVYKLLETFPKKEQFALSDQMRRCVISITSNIAEGFSRQSQKENLQFYFIAKGSLTELQNQLLIARDVRYLSPSQFSTIAEQTKAVSRLLTGLIRATKKMP